MTAAAFFDLDRTLLRRSSALALAGPFREHGVIGRGQLAKAAAWQLLFAARGASAETVRKAAEDGLIVLKGFPVDDLRALVAGAMEPILKPLVYQEPLNLVERHRERGEPVYIVSATLQEIVEELADELGFDGAIGSTCEIVDGVYTGRSLRGAHGDGKAAAVRELAAQKGFDLEASTAYSDSHTDLPFLEAVGHPVVVNPDRELRRIAEDRGWPMLEFTRARLSERAALAAGAAGDPARARRRRRGLGGAAACGLRSASPPSGSPRRTRRRSQPTSWTPSRAASSDTASPESTGSRLCPTCSRTPARSRLHTEPGYERWDGNGALGYLTLTAICDAQLAEPPDHARVVVASNCFPTGALGWYTRRLAGSGLAAALTATSPPRLSHPDGGEPLAGTNPLSIAIPSSDGKPLVADVSMGAVTHGDVLRGDAAPEELVPFGGEKAHKAFALALGLDLLVGALAGDGYGAVLVVARPEADPVPALRERAAGLRLPGDA